MAHSDQPTRTVEKQVGREELTITVHRSDPDYAGRIRIAGEETWAFGIDAEGIAHLLTTTAVGELADAAEPPTWVRDLLTEFGVVAVDDSGEAH